MVLSLCLEWVFRSGLGASIENFCSYLKAPFRAVRVTYSISSFISFNLMRFLSGKCPNDTEAVKRSTKLSNGCKIEGCEGVKFFWTIIEKPCTTGSQNRQILGANGILTIKPSIPERNKLLDHFSCILVVAIGSSISGRNLKEIYLESEIEWNTLRETTS